MKHIAKIQTLAVVAFSLTFSVSATAKPPTDNGSQPQSIMAPGESLGVPAELGPARDAFDAFLRLRYDGDAFYSKTEHELQQLHQRIYRHLTRAYTGDRINHEQATPFLDRLVSIGQAHFKAAEDPDIESPPTLASLEQLESDISVAMTERADPELMTPEIDRLIWLMETATRFADAGGTKSSDASQLRRELNRLLSDESRAKRNEDLSDRERLDLLRTTLNTWSSFARTFRDQ